MRRIHRNPTAALVVAAIALFLALQGPALAKTAKHMIDGSQVKTRSLPGSKLRDDSVTGRQVKESTLGRVPSAANALHATAAASAANADHATSADRATSAAGADHATNADHATAADHATSADTATNATTAASATTATHADAAARLDDTTTIHRTRITTVASGATFDAAQAAAAPLALYDDARFTVYAKCFVDPSSGNELTAAVYVRAKQAHSIFQAVGGLALTGPADGDYLSPGTSEDLTVLGSVAANDGETGFAAGQPFSAFAPDGGGISGEVDLGLGFDVPAAQAGPYGAGSACVVLGGQVRATPAS